MKEVEWVEARSARFTLWVDSLGHESSIFHVGGQNMILGWIFWGGIRLFLGIHVLSTHAGGA